MNFISSRENPNIKLCQKLLSSKKYRKEYGMFVLEGARLCLDAAGEGVPFEFVLVSSGAFEKNPDEFKILEKSSGGRIFEISPDLAQKLSDTGSTQGIFAVCKTLDKKDITSTICNNGKFIVLDNLQDPGNVGTIIRTADAVGISAVLLCGSCEIYNPKTIRSTMGSLFRVPFIENCDLREVLDEFKKKGIISYAAVVDFDAVSLTECDFSGGCAVVIGNEGRGLPDEDAGMCDKKLTIKMKGSIDSLNAAMAAGIIMWEMTRK